MWNNMLYHGFGYEDDDYLLMRQRAREEELQRRREAAYRQRQEELRRRAYEQELARREEEEYRRRLREQEKLRRSRFADNRRQQGRHPEQEAMSAPNQIVRGPDGQLYRVPVSKDENYEIIRGPDGCLYRVRRAADQMEDYPTAETLFPRAGRPEESRGRREDQSSHTRQSPGTMVSENEELTSGTVSKKEHGYDIVRGRDGRLYRVRKDYAEFPTGASSEEENVPPTTVPMEKPSEPVKQKGWATTKVGRKQKKPRRKKLTVIVEDASDSEYEEDELHSVFRNRRPGPGESWMEPLSVPDYQ